MFEEVGEDLHGQRLQTAPLRLHVIVQQRIVEVNGIRWRGDGGGDGVFPGQLLQGLDAVHNRRQDARHLSVLINEHERCNHDSRETESKGISWGTRTVGDISVS